MPVPRSEGVLSARLWLNYSGVQPDRRAVARSADRDPPLQRVVDCAGGSATLYIRICITDFRHLTSC